MPALSFTCVDATPERYAVTPTFLFHLRIAEATGVRVHALALRCQIRIEPARRTYDGAEEDDLFDLFGERARWGDTLKPMQFAMVSQLVPGFTGSTDIMLVVPCTYDLEVAAAKYFNALGDGEIPFLLLFSGTVFFEGGPRLLVEQVPWDVEARHRMPVRVWRELVDAHFPNTAWVRMRRDTYAMLARFKSRRALPTWDQTFEVLLAESEGGPWDREADRQDGEHSGPEAGSSTGDAGGARAEPGCGTRADPTVLPVLSLGAGEETP